MITPFQIYLISIADNIRVTIIISSILAGISLFVGILGFFVNYGDGDYKLAKSCKTISIISFSILILSGLLSMFVPSTKSLIAVYAVPTIVNNKEVQKLPENLVRFANDYLEKLNKKEDKE